MAGRMHRLIFGHFGAFCALAAVFCAACAWLAARSGFNQSVSDILPVRDTLVKEHEYALEKFRQANSLYFSVSAPGAGASPAEPARDLAKRLGGLPGAESVIGDLSGAAAPDPEMLAAYLPALFDGEARAEAERLVSPEETEKRLAYMKAQMLRFGSPAYAKILKSDPFGMFAAVGAKRAFPGAPGTVKDGAIISPDGASALVVARFSADSSDSEASSMLVGEIEAALGEFLRDNPGVRVAWAGAYRISADNAKMASEDSAKCLAISVAAVCAICLAAFRRRALAVFAVCPSLAGTLFAFALIGTVFDSVSSISVGFASIAIGVTIDYALHVIYRVNACRGGSIGEISAAVSELSKPVGIGAATTIIAFAIMFFAGSSGFRQLGVFGAAGVAASAMISMFALPPFLAKFGFRPAGPSVFDRAAAALESAQKRHAPAFFAAAGAATALSLAAVGGLEFDGRISSFSGLFEGTKRDDASIRETWPGAVSRTLVIARGATLDEALEKNAELFALLKSDPDVAGIDSIAPILPPSGARAENLERWRKFFSPEFIEKFSETLSSAAGKTGIKPSAFDGALARAAAPDPEAALERIMAGPLAAAVSEKICEGDGDAAVATLLTLRSGADKFEFRRRIGGEGPDVIVADNAMFEEHISRLAKGWMLKFLALSVGLVSAYLALSFRSAKTAMIAIAPIALGLLWTFAAMAALGMPVTIVNAIFVIFAVCIAEDYAVFIACEKMRGEPAGALQSVMASALTTVAGFGALGFAHHPVLKGLGMTAAISIAAILAACIAVSLPLSERLADAGRR